MIYTEKVKTALKDIGKDNKIKNRAILEILENVASYHSDLVGYGANDIGETKSSWILLDWKLRVLDRPKYGQVLTVNTWAKGIEKFFTHRDFEIFDEENKLCAIATSKWALVDVEKGKMIRIEEKIMDRYYPEKINVFSEEKMGKLETTVEIDSSIKYEVIRKDIDLNGHMHNLYYLDLAYEALPEEVYAKRPFDNVRITYKKEIKLGDIVHCNYANKNGKNIIKIESKDGEKNNLHSIIEIY